MEVLKAEHLTKVYGSGENEVRALDDVSFYIQRGEFVAIICPTSSPAVSSSGYPSEEP